MTSFRKTALVGGILYLVTFVGSIASAILVGPALNDPAYILGAGADQQIGLAAILELVNVFGLIGCGIAFFSVVRQVHEGLAIGYLATRLFEGAIITISVVSLLSIMTLHQQVAAGADGEALVPVAAALVAVRNWAIVIGSNMAPFNALMLGTALYRARLVPRAMPALGLVGAPILISFVIGNILGVAQRRDPLPRRRGDAVLHLGARARPVADVQGLQRELADRDRRASASRQGRDLRSRQAVTAEAGAA